MDSRRVSGRLARSWMMLLPAVAGCFSKTSGDTHQDGGVPFVVTTGPTSGTVSGTVEDAVTGAPLTGAIVSLVGGAMTGTAGDGSFRVDGASGRPELVVTAVGYLEWRREALVTSLDQRRRVRLMPLAPAQTVGASGGTVAAGIATLVFPAGAYAGDQQISVTSIDRSRIGSAPGVVQFEDPTGLHRVIVAIHVEATAQPASAVTVRLAIPAGVPASQVSLYELGSTRAWVNRIAPTSTTGGVATFNVTHFSDYAGVWDDPPSAAVCTEVGIGGAFEEEAGTAAPLAEGDLVEVGHAMAVPPGSSATLVDPAGNELRVDTAFDRFNTATSRLINQAFGAVAEYVFPDPPPHTEVIHRDPSGRVFMIRSRVATFGVRGTAFAVDGRQCEQSSRETQRVEVVEGTVEVSSGGLPPVTVTAGHQATGCDGCSDPQHPVCCDPTTCATGCCSEGDECETGESAAACGAEGAACTTCGSGTTCIARTCAPLSCPDISCTNCITGPVTCTTVTCSDGSSLTASCGPRTGGPPTHLPCTCTLGDVSVSADLGFDGTCPSTQACLTQF